MEKTFNDFKSKKETHDNLLKYLIKKTKEDSIVWAQDYNDAIEPKPSIIYYTKLDMPLKSNKETIFYPIFDRNDIKALVPGMEISIVKDYDITIANFKVIMYINASLNNDNDITIEDEEIYSKSEPGLLITLFETIENKGKYLDEVNEEKAWKHIYDFLEENK